jgi:hypothetical protein
MYDSHPLGLLVRIADAARKAMNSEPIFTLQAYEAKEDIYGKGNFRDKESVRIYGKDLLEEAPQFLSASKDKGFDVIVESRMDFDHQESLHIPMIDFATTQHSLLGLLDEMLDVTGVDPADLVLFNSGRSFHGYAIGGLSETKWRHFTAGLLLLSVPGKQEVVDRRWVGHRLQKGCGGLRLTKVSKKYLQMPSLVHNPYETCPF